MTDLDAAIRNWATQYPWLGYVLIAAIVTWALWKTMALWRLRRRNRRTQREFGAREERRWRSQRRDGRDRRASRPRIWAVVMAVVVAVGVGVALNAFSSSRHDRPDTDSRSVSRADDNPVLVGTVTKVTDGDSLWVEIDSGPIEVRLYSVDAPESNQPWGQEATDALRRRVMHQRVVLEVQSQDRYDRQVAVVFFERDDASVNRWLVEQGHGWVYRQYARDPRFCQGEHAARTARLGLWSLPPDERVAPWEWRQSKRGGRQRFTDYRNETAEDCIAALGQRPAAARPAAESASAPPAFAAPRGGCQIKGNISSSGRVYHVPGSRSYEATRIDESKGERYFCSEEEAKAAGWRPPRGS